MKRLAFAWLALSTLFAVGQVAAQTDQTGVIDGQVLDPRGRAVAGAIVLGAKADGAYPRNAITDDEGRFRFAFLPPGRYDLSIKAGSFRDQVVSDVLVRAASSAKIEVRLQPATDIVETMTVVATAPLIDVTSTELSTTLSASETEALPYSRNATDLLLFVPGGREDQLWGGSTQQANAYQLDGVNVTDPGFGGDFLLPNVDWIEEFQVRGLGAGAEYGNFQGGLVNIVTKSGSNTFEGSVRTNFETSELNSDNVNAAEAGEDLDQRFELNASVSGPFIKDKLYYFFSAQQVDRDLRVVDPSVSDRLVFLSPREERTEQKLYGKLTWQATDKDVFHFVLGVDDVETDNRDINSIDAPSTATTQESPATFWNASWQHIFGANSFLEVKLTGYDGDDDRTPLNGERTSVRYLGGGGRATFRNARFARTRTRENTALYANWDYYVETGKVRHHFKVGGEYNQGSWLETRDRTGSLTWRPAYDSDLDPAESNCGRMVADPGDPPNPDCFDPEDPATWLDDDPATSSGTPRFISADFLGGIRLDADILNAGFWIQDYMTVSPRVSVNFGVRFGKWTGEVTPGFPPAGVPRSKFEAIDDTAIDPRVGVTWDIRGDQTWVAKAHWGRYHQNLFALFFDRVSGSFAFQDELYFDWCDSVQTGCTNAFDPATIPIDGVFPIPDANDDTDEWRPAGSEPTGQENGPIEDYDQPYVDQWVLSLERGIGDRWKLGATYVNRSFEQIVALQDRNIDSNFLRYENVRVEDGANSFVLPELYIHVDDVFLAADTSGVAAPGLTLAESLNVPIFDRDFVLTNVDDAEREMDQIQLVAERRGKNISFAGSLVWTDLQGNFFSVNGYDDPDGIGAGAFVDPNQQINFDGNLQNYSEWVAKLRLTARLPRKIRLGAFIQWDTGEFYTPEFEIRYDSGQRFFAANGEEFNVDHFSELDRETVFVEERGSREFGDLKKLDLHLDRPYKLSEDVTLSLALDLFNVFNDDAITEVETLGNENEPFNEVRLRQNPRTLRLSAALSW